MRRTAVLLTAVVALFAAACSSTSTASGTLAAGSAAPSTSVTVGFVVDPTWAQVPVAAAAGYFAAHHVHVKVVDFDTGPAAQEALQGGQVDVATSADVPVAAALIHDPAMRIVADGSRWPGQRIVASRSAGITSLADLNGKTVGVPFGTSAQYYLTAALAQLPNVKPKLVNVAPPDMVAAMTRHSVDAVVVFDPYQTQVQQALGADAVTLGSPVYVQQGLFLSTTAKLASNGKGIAAFLAAVAEADGPLQQANGAALTALSTATGLGSGLVKSVAGSFQYGLELPASLPGELATLAKWGQSVGNIPASAAIPDYARFVDASVLPK